MTGVANTHTYTHISLAIQHPKAELDQHFCHLNLRIKLKKMSLSQRKVQLKLMRLCDPETDRFINVTSLFQIGELNIKRRDNELLCTLC